MLTLLALPTIWLINRSDGGNAPRPNVAAVGLDPGSADHDDFDAHSDPDDDYDPFGDVGAVYVRANPRQAEVEPPEIVVGTEGHERVGSAKATYRGSVPPGECRFNGVAAGTRVTIVNVANGRSVSCTTAFGTDEGAALVVLSGHQFDQIADRVAAPIHVEVRR